VTPEEIRLIRPTSLPLGSPDYLKHEAVGMFLREIAALLAERNELGRIADERNAAESKKRDELLATSSAGIEAFRKSVETPAQIVPVLRILGCFVLLPNGTYGMAISGENGPGIVPFEDEEAKRILAILTKRSEGKPQ
jgi:hypothetical protein